MEKNKLHIVSLDVPYPADYGGAIDIYYRIKALFEIGFEITLHVFEYGRGKQSELDKYANVIYYERSRSFFYLFSKRPFIVQSRKNNQLLANLLKDDAPILFEGIHTTWYLENENISKRYTLVRMHNIEHEYYHGLKKNSSFLKKLFFHHEAKKLKRYQEILSKCSAILAIKNSDVDTLKAFNPNVYILPASFPDITGSYTKVERYALFHGNLSVPENIHAAQWIIKTLKSVIDPTFPLIIAGKNPSKKLQFVCRQNNIKLIANPNDNVLEKLVQEAQIHVLHTSVPSGIKLKLLACVHSSGRILVNDLMVRGTMLEPFCTIANNSKEYKLHYIGLKNDALTKKEFDMRHDFISSNFNNQLNCSLITKLISNESTL